LRSSTTSKLPAAAIAVALCAAVAAISSAALLVRCSRSPPLVIAFYRLAYATAMLAPISLARARARPPARDALLLAATGIVLAIHFACWITSLAPASPFATSVAASTVLVTMHPLVVVLATPFVLRESVPGRAWLGILVAFAGGVWIAMADARVGVHRLIGDLLAFLGAIAAAAYFLVGRRLRGRMSLLSYVTPVYAVAAVALGIGCLVTRQPITHLPFREHALFVALAAGPMILGHTVLNWSLRHVPAWGVSTAILAEPVASSALVFVALGERPTTAAMVGGVTVLVGVGIAARQSLRDQARSASASNTDRTPSTSDVGGVDVAPSSR
jgi:drug/metabolite transporter (DMT)-like permease